MVDKTAATLTTCVRVASHDNAVGIVGMPADRGLQVGRTVTVGGVKPGFRRTQSPRK